MPKNTDKDSSKLVLSNGNEIDVSNYEMVVSNGTNSDVSDAIGAVVAGRGMGKSYSGNFTLEPDYQERFEQEQERLVEILESGQSINKQDLELLVMKGNKAVWQESKND